MHDHVSLRLFTWSLISSREKIPSFDSHPLKQKLPLGWMAIDGGDSLFVVLFVGSNIISFGYNTSFDTSFTNENICSLHGFRHFPSKHSATFPGEVAEGTNLTLFVFRDMGHSTL